MRDLALPPYLVRQLHEEPVVHSLETTPVELAVALHGAAVPYEGHSAGSWLEGSEQIEPETVEFRRRCGHTPDDERGASPGLLQRCSAPRAVLADRAEE